MGAPRLRSARRWHRASAALLIALAGLACGGLDEGSGGLKSNGTGRVIEGSLGPGDEMLQSGEWVDELEIEAVAGQRLNVHLASDDFDTYLVLVGPDGQFVENDDDEVGDSSLRLRLPLGGPHRILVTSFQAGESGDYALEIRLGDVGPLPEVAELALGERVDGVLDEDDEILTEGEPMDFYRFDAEAGTPVVVTMTSAELDTFLELIFPDGTSLTNDDDWENQERSRIELTLPQTGSYEIVASAYWAEQAGSYTLALERSRARSPLRGAPSRTFALLAGISDYAGAEADLEWTADDARNLRRGLVERAGVAADDTILLVDEEVTLERFRGALAELASRMGASDELLIFYSGHGGRVRRATFQPADPDAVDETLSLHDGDLTDDELAALLADVPGRVLLVLDSCFSGGFAKDVVSRPDRMGIFSSEEDVTSSVAEKFEAGGFLSAFLVRALTDEFADGDGDGRLTTLELSHYLHENYRTGVKGGGPDDFVPTGGPMLGYQRLVVDRGSLAPTDILFDLRGGG